MRAKKFVYVLLILGLALSGVASPKQAQAQGAAPAGEFVPGEVVVVFSEEVPDPSAGAAALADMEGGVVAAVRGTAALLRLDASADVAAVVDEIEAQAGVSYAEPNYIYRIPGSPTPSPYAAPPTYVVRQPHGSDQEFAIPIETLQTMKTRKGSTIKATYPSDPYLWYSHAYDDVLAPIVWSNTTVSKNICEIDTGVDNLHPDLSGRIVLGKDFVNEDTNPMDDNGHGTHVAGIMVATQNNAKGLAGIAPNAKVVAVKALNAQGSGTNFDVASAINYCANRTDISVINMSLGGPYAQFLEDAVAYATNTKLKLLVAAAGNDNVASYCGYVDDNGTPINPADDFWVNQGDERAYPAGFTIEANNYSPAENCANDLGTQKHPGYEGVVSVASSGDYFGDVYDPWAKSSFSNYGDWVTFIAPGMDVYSTLPYDKPFDLYYYGFPSRYGWLSGTSMAAPAAAATIARGWGYLLTVAPSLATDPDLNTIVRDYVFDRSLWLGFDFDGWPAEQPVPTPKANVAYVLERGAAFGYAVDATTGNAIPNTTLQVYQGATLKASAIAGKEYGGGSDIPEQYVVPASWAEIINLPAANYPTIYTPKVSITNYTATPANAFVSWEHADASLDVWAGYWSWTGYAAVPPKTANFSAVSTWVGDLVYDLDQIAYLPPLPKLDGQPAQFVVNTYSPEFGRIGYILPADNPEDGTGSLGVFPLARHMRLSEATGNGFGSTSEATVVRNRFVSLGTGFPANTALPYYTGTYEFWVSDWGQFFDEGLPGEGPLDLPGLSEFSTDDFSPHLSMFIWKDGVLKLRVNRGALNGQCIAREHLWRPVIMTSGAAGAVTITPMDQCAEFGDVPYGDMDIWGRTPIE